MSGPRTKGWFNFFLMLMSVTAGYVVYYGVDSFLTPYPMISTLPGIVLKPNKNYVREYLLDSTGRWFCVHTAGLATDRVRRFQVYDLLTHGKETAAWDWDRAGEVATVPINQGVRVLTSRNDRLQIADKDFVTGKDRQLDFDIPCPNDYLRLQLTDSGNQLVLFQRWPLWPWRMLAGMGQPSFDALFLQNQISSECYNAIADGLMVSVYDVTSSKLIRRFVLAPPVILQTSFTSSDGCWLIVPEAFVSQDSFCWKSPIDQSQSTGRSETLIPAEPRGVRVVDLRTGDLRVLRTIEIERKNRREAGAETVTMHGSFVRLHFYCAFSINGSRIDGYSVESTDKEYAYPTYDLTTGSLSTKALPTDYPLGQSTWHFGISYPRRSWFPFLQSLGTNLGIDLNKRSPLPSYLQVQFRRTYESNEEPFFEYRRNMKSGESLRHSSSADHNAALVFHSNTERTEILRWQIPFEVYSPWWSIAAGFLTSILLLTLWYRRTTQHLAPSTQH